MKSFKQICIDLRRKDHTLNEIIEITGRSKTTVYYHIKDIALSEEKRKQISENSRRLAIGVASSRRGIALRPFQPFDKWTPELVLLTAHMVFDGEISKTCAYNNRSSALIGRFVMIMKQVYSFPPKRYLNSVTGVIKVCYNNVAMANFFKLKSNELLSCIPELPTSYQREFLRAFFDDEGCMDFRTIKNKRSIRGYQNDVTILRTVELLLKNFDIDSKLQGRNEVVISGKENLIRFRDEINFSKGVRINPNRTNSLWKKNLEKRKLLDMAIASFKK